MGGTDFILTEKGAVEIGQRAVECVEVLCDELDNEALVDSSITLATGMAPDGRLYQIHVKLTFEEFDFNSDTDEAVLL